VKRSERLSLVPAGVLVLAGVLFAALPKDWIEETFGVEPDAGNGLLELALVVVPIVLGVALAVRVWLAVRARRAELTRR
jgi:apolipoprotein N-acyltransferase